MDTKKSKLDGIEDALNKLADATEKAKANPNTERRWSKGKGGWDKKKKSEKEETKEKVELKFADLLGLLDGTIVQEVPTVAPVAPGRSLFYRGAVNEIHGEPSVGKTNILAAAVIADLLAGGLDLVMDPEDTAAGFIAKIRSLCCDDPAVLQAIRDGRLKYLHNPEPAEIQAAQEWAVENKPTLVALDGLAEALAAEGLNEDVAGDVLKFFRTQIRPFAEEAGAAVLVADHVAKAKDGGAWSRGSGAKLGRYDGVSYEVKLGQAYSPTVAGYVKLVVSKDRKGGVGPKGKHICNLHFSPDGVGTETRWENVAKAQEPQESNSGGAECTRGIENEILRSLFVFRNQTKADLEKSLRGRSDAKRAAILALHGRGMVTVTRVGKADVVELTDLGSKLATELSDFAKAQEPNWTKKEAT